MSRFHVVLRSDCRDQNVFCTVADHIGQPVRCSTLHLLPDVLNALSPLNTKIAHKGTCLSEPRQNPVSIPNRVTRKLRAQMETRLSNILSSMSSILSLVIYVYSKLKHTSEEQSSKAHCCARFLTMGRGFSNFQGWVGEKVCSK